MQLVRNRTYTIYPIDKARKYQGVILAQETGLRPKETEPGTGLVVRPADQVQEYLVQRAGVYRLAKGTVVLVRVEQ